jgi:hypothetical protein
LASGPLGFSDNGRRDVTGLQGPIRLSDDELARFFAKVNLAGPVMRADLGPCHEWTACRNGPAGRDHGRFVLRGRREYAHRVAFLIEHGRWPDPQALHRCDHPPCVRGAHLFEGTVADNMADRDRKGRQAHQERHGRAKLTWDQVRELRALHADGLGYRRLTQHFARLGVALDRSTVRSIALGETWTEGAAS